MTALYAEYPVLDGQDFVDYTVTIATGSGTHRWVRPQAIFRFEGMVTVFDPRNGPTYRDMVPEPPPAEMAPSCAEAGVLGVLPGIIGSLQAIEAIKLILGLGDSLSGRLLAYDAMEQSFREYKVRVDPTNEITYANRDRIVVAELEGACMPYPLAPPAA